MWANIVRTSSTRCGLRDVDPDVLLRLEDAGVCGGVWSGIVDWYRSLRLSVVSGSLLKRVEDDDSCNPSRIREHILHVVIWVESRITLKDESIDRFRFRDVAT